MASVEIRGVDERRDGGVQMCGGGWRVGSTDVWRMVECRCVEDGGGWECRCVEDGECRCVEDGECRCVEDGGVQMCGGHPMCCCSLYP